MVLKLFLLLLLTIFTVTREDRVITTIKYSTFRVAPTIIHGNPVLPGQIPYLVSIKTPKGKITKKKLLWNSLCGGSIISPLKVLTAAHCFESNNFYYAKHYNELRIVAGSLRNELRHTGRTQTSNKTQWRSLVKVTLHKEFVFPVHDIALVFIDSEFIFSKHVGYVIPARRMTDYPRTCIAAGFGYLSNEPGSPLSKELMWADMFTLSRRQCDTWWEMNMDTFICTSSRVTDVAGGDSGGPLACYGTLDPNERRGRDLLVGIICGKNIDKTTLFTRVAAYDKWLDADSGSQCAPTKLVVSFCLMITLFFIRLLILFICTLEEFVGKDTMHMGCQDLTEA